MRVPGVPYVQGRNSYARRTPHYGIAIHNTSNDATADGEADYAARRTDGTSAHFYVDKTKVIQSLDTHKRAGHAASTFGNDYAIAVEIVGTNGKTRAWWLANVAWDKLATTLAWVIKNDPDHAGFQVRRASVSEMKANPKVRAFYSHNDMRLAFGGTTHDDPGPNFPWDHFLAKVKAAVGGTATPGDEDEDMPTADEIAQATVGRMGNLFNRVEGIASLRASWPNGTTTETSVIAPTLLGMKAQLAALTTAVVKLADQADVDQIVAAVKAEGDKAAARSAEDATRDAALIAAVNEFEGGGATAEQVVARVAAILAGAANMPTE